MMRCSPNRPTTARVRRATTAGSRIRQWMPFDTPSRSAATSALAAARCLLATRVGTCTAPARCTNSEGPSRLAASQRLSRKRICRNVTRGSRMQQVKGVAARSKGAPVEVVPINVLRPGRPGTRSVRAENVAEHVVATRRKLTSAPKAGPKYPRRVRLWSSP